MSSELWTICWVFQGHSNWRSCRKEEIPLLLEEIETTYQCPIDLVKIYRPHTEVDVKIFQGEGI